MRNGVKSLIGFLVVLAGIVITDDMRDSFRTPDEAIRGHDSSMHPVKAEVDDEKALYFFIKEPSEIGAVELEKGWFGWETDFFSWSEFDSTGLGERLFYKTHNGEFAYGLIEKQEGEQLFLNDDPAEWIDLTSLDSDVRTKLELDNMSIWFAPIEDGNLYEISLQNEQGEELQTGGFNTF